MCRAAILGGNYYRALFDVSMMDVGGSFVARTLIIHRIEFKIEEMRRINWNISYGLRDL